MRQLTLLSLSFRRSGTGHDNWVRFGINPEHDDADKHFWCISLWPWCLSEVMRKLVHSTSACGGDIEYLGCAQPSLCMPITKLSNYQTLHLVGMRMWNDIVLSDTHHLFTSRPYQVAQTSLPGELRLAPHAPSPGWHAFSLS